MTVTVIANYAQPPHTQATFHVPQNSYVHPNNIFSKTLRRNLSL